MANNLKRNLPSEPARILVIRGRRVILDSDLAELYGVPTRRLNEQVHRNRPRFPSDFAIQLSASEWQDLMSQFATSSWGGRRKPPYAFTEHGALMAASVLNSARAVDVSIHVVRTFVALREAATNSAELARRLQELETRLERRLEKHDQAIAEILRAIRELMAPAAPRSRPIGFVRGPDDKP